MSQSDFSTIPFQCVSSCKIIRHHYCAVWHQSYDLFDFVEYLIIKHLIQILLPVGVIAGAVCAVVLFVLLVCLAVFIFLKRPDIIRLVLPHLLYLEYFSEMNSIKLRELFLLISHSRQKTFIGGSKQSNKKFK